MSFSGGFFKVEALLIFSELDMPEKTHIPRWFFFYGPLTVGMKLL